LELVNVALQLLDVVLQLSILLQLVPENLYKGLKWGLGELIPPAGRGV
jgi:hypothetical protein